MQKKTQNWGSINTPIPFKPKKLVGDHSHMQACDGGMGWFYHFALSIFTFLGILFSI